jgi:hypothetical protein
VHAAQRSLSLVERNVALHHSGVKPAILEFLLTPAARKETSAVLGWLEVNFENTGQLGFLESHVG